MQGKRCRNKKTRSMYQFKITLRGSKPLIWRRFITPDSATLPRLHDIIQTVMGWTDCHLHEFVAGNAAYGVPDPDWPSDMKNEARVRIHSLVNKENKKYFTSMILGMDGNMSVSWKRSLPWTRRHQNPDVLPASGPAPRRTAEAFSATSIFWRQSKIPIIRSMTGSLNGWAVISIRRLLIFRK